MITLNTLKITTLAVITALSLNACKSTSSTQQTAASRVSIADGNARAEAYLNEAGKKIKMAIANGDITEEEGRLKYAAVAKRVEKRMAGSKSKTANTDARAMRAKYKEASDKMTEMVKTGEITREQMEGRLNRMKKGMAGSKSKTANTDARAMRAKYKEASDKMTEMVKSGEITREQMKARLNRMKKAMASKDEPSDDCIELRKKLGESVQNGEMTREEAGQIWKEEGC